MIYFLKKSISSFGYNLVLTDDKKELIARIAGKWSQGELNILKKRMILRFNK